MRISNSIARTQRIIFFWEALSESTVLQKNDGRTLCSEIEEEEGRRNWRSLKTWQAKKTKKKNNIK
jgi:hypothetical protein